MVRSSVVVPAPEAPTTQHGHQGLPSTEVKNDRGRVGVDAKAGAQQAGAACHTVFDRSPAPSTESFTGALTGLGMPRRVAATYLECKTELRRFDSWV
jgi:hypothetical protein